MKTRWTVFAGFLAVLSAVLISGAAGSKPTSQGSSFNVTITVYDTDANGLPTHIGSDDHNGTGYAVYNSSQDPNTVTDVYAETSCISTSTASRLGLCSSTRTILFRAAHLDPHRASTGKTLSCMRNASTHPERLFHCSPSRDRAATAASGSISTRLGSNTNSIWGRCSRVA